MDAMVDADYCRKNRARIRFGSRMVQALREDAVEHLREAKASHDRLEAVYHPYVDFAGVEAAAQRELLRLESFF